MWKEMHVEEAILVWIHFTNKMETGCLRQQYQVKEAYMPHLALRHTGYG